LGGLLILLVAEKHEINKKAGKYIFFWGGGVFADIPTGGT
jgi:hypothetical protein